MNGMFHKVLVPYKHCLYAVLTMDDNPTKDTSNDIHQTLIH